MTNNIPKGWRLEGSCVKADDESLPLDYPEILEHYKCRQLICESIDTKRGKLAAAAPELLQVAEWLLEYGSINPPHWIWEKAEDAVMKAGRL